MTRARLAIVLILLGVALVGDLPRASADAVVATVPVGSVPQQVQLTPDGTELFVSNEADGTVSVISTAANTVIGSPIPVGLNPGPIRFTPDGAKAYVVNEDSGTVSVIGVATHTVTATVPVGDRPVTLSRTDDGTKVYVANELSNNVSVISTADDTVIDTIPVGTAPHTLAKTPDGTKLYVANEGAASNSISVISTTTDSVIATIPLSPSRDPGSIHFLPNGTKAYVANRGCAGIACVPTEVAPTVSVIDVATNSVIGTITVGLPGAAPHAMRITPNGQKLYLVNKHGDDVKVINTATNTVVKTILLQQGSCSNISFGVGSCPVRVELTADGSRAYVVEQRPLATSGRLTAICTGMVPAVCGGASTDAAVGTVAVGGSPVDVEITAGGKAYVSNSGSNSVSVVALDASVAPGADTDGDGCADVKELATNPALGGRRDPLYVWDFMDQYVGNPFARDKIVAVGDVGAVVRRFGAVGDPNGDPLTPPVAGTGYHTSADRNGSIPGQDPWDLRPPDGTISVGDIGAVVAQFGHSCA